MMQYRHLLLYSALATNSLLAADEKKPADPVEKLAEQVRASIAVISTADRKGVQSGTGTGFVVQADGVIATNFHVIGLHRGFSVRLADGETYEPTAILATDRKRDLALIKIEAKGLKPLALGDSDSLKPGQGVFAIGNPLGLDFSVSRGVVATPARDVDGNSMIQVAMPIEPGSSGSPVLDMDGNVRGVIAIKTSAAMGFAVPVNHLKSMMENSRPIPMKHWLTIGALDAEEWKVHLGGHWRQRAGRLIASGRGTGFGGRTLCISQQNAPQDKFACEVEVKLDEESGAAGLAFYHDDQYNHYGFYPTAGSLRLTRFAGPDVFSWTILDTVESDAYRPGEWNRIRVDYNKGHFDCKVNGRTVLKFKDNRLKPGKFGLVKFRNPTAEFRNFRFGSELTDSTIPRKLTSEVNRLVEGIDPRAAPAHDASLHKELLDAGPRVPDILRARAKRLEEESAQLRNLAKQVHDRLVIRDLVASLNPSNKKPVDLLEATLHLARLDNPHLAAKPYQDRLDRMAAKVKNTVPDCAKPRELLDALIKHMFQEQGFHGSGLDYYHRSNSYINEVLDDREGLPITLTVVFIELARRLDLPVHGLGVPSHFIAAYHPPAKEKEKPALPVLIDVFGDGKIISREQAQELSAGPILDEHLRPAKEKDILVRMLYNLLNVAEIEGDRTSMIRYLDAIIAIDESKPSPRAMRSMLLYSEGRKAEALHDLEWIVSREPEGIDLGRIRTLLDRLYLEQQGR